MQRFRIKCAASLILSKYENNEEYVLLQHRSHTGVLDNMWGVSACGHLEKGETLKQCIIRETLEEINIKIKEEDLMLVNIVHANFEGTEYIMPVFNASKYFGNIKINEPEKCDGLQWFKITDLPEDMDSSRRQMIEDYLNKINYRETGFKE